MLEVDSIKVTFKKTSYFLEADQDGIFTVPDNFEVISTLPPQKEELVMSVENNELTDASAKTLILTNLLFGFFFKYSINVFFSSIISLQILAHLPLANITLPANALECFDIMVKIVSFDYFPIA